MSEKDFYNSVSAIKSLMADNGLAMQKRFGQNFLISQRARIDLIKLLQLDKNSTVWEIGPGIGSITSLLAEQCKALTVFEIDRGFILFLKEFFKNYNFLNIIEGDALKNWPDYYELNGLPDVVVGNLPYNVGSLIIASFIEKTVLPPVMVFTVQREVAIRMGAKAGSKDYSSFSMLCQLDYNVKKVMDLPASSFYPRPDVVSAVVKMEYKLDEKECRILEGFSLDDKEIRAYYFRAVRDLFKARRKTIRNNLIKSGLLSSIDKIKAELLCKKCGINPEDRGEKLPYQSVWKLAGEFQKLF